MPALREATMSKRLARLAIAIPPEPDPATATATPRPCCSEPISPEGLDFLIGTQLLPATQS